MDPLTAALKYKWPKVRQLLDMDDCRSRLNKCDISVVYKQFRFGFRLYNTPTLVFRKNKNDDWQDIDKMPLVDFINKMQSMYRDFSSKLIMMPQDERLYAKNYYPYIRRYMRVQWIPSTDSICVTLIGYYKGRDRRILTLCTLDAHHHTLDSIESYFKKLYHRSLESALQHLPQPIAEEIMECV